MECNFPHIESNQNGGRCGRFRFSCAKRLPSFCRRNTVPEQFKALKTFAYGTDVLLNLPTGFGKSLVFQMAPLVHAELSRGRDGFAANPVIIIISPLVSLMEDQTSYLRKCGISACSIGEDKVLDMRIEKGECCVVFSSPESLLGNGRWRSMLSSDVYQKNLIGIVVDEAHCISHW